MANLLNTMIVASEKAANIARACRENKDLFNLLVEEKSEDEANARFIKDFKTLADVLIQETVRHDIEQNFPVLGKHIFGEENNIFTNTLGETVEVKVCASEIETAALLESVLDGNSNVAKILAFEVHKIVQISDINVENVTLPSNMHIDVDNLGLWIDPIDSTAEYIHAKETKHDSGIHLTGLRCVTVLIGAFDKTSGIPLIGVVNQPFHENHYSQWQGKCFWGLRTSQVQLSSLRISDQQTNTITLSRIETDAITTKLTEAGYTLVEAAGAGYKLLSVITGIADAYIVSQGTTFRWDVCGPHAILRSLGGGIFDYSKAIEGDFIEIDYKNIDDSDIESKNKKFSNKNGLIAVKNKEVLNHIVHLLRE